MSYDKRDKYVGTKVPTSEVFKELGDPATWDKFGIWGGRAPGGWCHIYMPEVEPYFGAHMGTQEQAEKGATSFRSDYPDYKYEVIPFDPNKEPQGKVSKPSARQLKAMVCIKHVELWSLRHDPAMGRGASQRFFSLTPKNTQDSLFMRGWVMFIHDGGGLDLGVSLTKVGREVLARYGT